MSAMRDVSMLKAGRAGCADWAEGGMKRGWWDMGSQVFYIRRGWKSLRCEISGRISLEQARAVV